MPKIINLCKPVNIMRVIDLLNEQKHSKLLSGYENGMKHLPSNKKPLKRNVERFTDKELEELMGVNRDRYKRVNGKVKRK